MNNPKRRDPKAPKGGLLVEKWTVARSQLETAIVLWFNYADPIAILALAHNAQDCYAALTAHIQKPSPYKLWMASQSQAFKDRARYIPNWIKHGHKDLSAKPLYNTDQGEILIVDAISCHENLFLKKTRLMAAFTARFGLENAEFVLGEMGPTVRQAADVYDFANHTRPKFLGEILKQIAVNPGSHL